MTAALYLLMGVPLSAQEVTQIRAWHRAGQTFLIWKEVSGPVVREGISIQELKDLQTRFEQAQRVRYRIYRSHHAIKSVAGLKPIAEVAPSSGWNMDYYGIYPKPDNRAFRYVLLDGKDPVAPGTAIHVHNPREAGPAYYAVTVSINGKENSAVGSENVLQSPIDETVGPGIPVLQRVIKPKSFQYIENPTLNYYVRWEDSPAVNVPGKPFDYVVAIPPNVAKPAPVGIHLHPWGGNLNEGYLWWYNAEKGAILIASNQIPYDWWTGYHEHLGTAVPLKSRQDWTNGVVRPYTQRRLLEFLNWVATRWQVDLTKTFVAGGSMGGSGAVKLALRFPERIAWAIAGVGVHVPEKSPQYKSSYAAVYGEPEWRVKFEDGTPVWDYFNDAWFWRRRPEKDIGFINFSNGKNDGGIGWPQAVEFYRALQETRQPHMFVWGQEGHGQRPIMPIGGGERVMPLDLRTNRSLPAFTSCSLDDNPGNGDPANGDKAGQINSYLYWETETIVDKNDQWEMTVGLLENAPREDATVNITPRRRQEFKTRPGELLSWQNVSLVSRKVVQAGRILADDLGLVTLPAVIVGKGKNRLTIAR